MWAVNCHHEHEPEHPDAGPGPLPPQGNYTTNYGLVMAGAALTFMPPFIPYIFLQKEFVEGIALSGVKGAEKGRKYGKL